MRVRKRIPVFPAAGACLAFDQFSSSSEQLRDSCVTPEKVRCVLCFSSAATIFGGVLGSAPSVPATCVLWYRERRVTLRVDLARADVGEAAAGFRVRLPRGQITSTVYNRRLLADPVTPGMYGAGYALVQDNSPLGLFCIRGYGIPLGPLHSFKIRWQ